MGHRWFYLLVGHQTRMSLRECAAKTSAPRRAGQPVWVSDTRTAYTCHAVHARTIQPARKRRGIRTLLRTPGKLDTAKVVRKAPTSALLNLALRSCSADSGGRCKLSSVAAQCSRACRRASVRTAILKNEIYQIRDKLPGHLLTAIFCPSESYCSIDLPWIRSRAQEDMQ